MAGVWPSPSAQRVVPLSAQMSVQYVLVRRGYNPTHDDPLPATPCRNDVFAHDAAGGTDPRGAAAGCASVCAGTGGCAAFWSYDAVAMASTYGRCCLKGVDWVNGSFADPSAWRVIRGGAFYAMQQPPAPPTPPTPAPPTPVPSTSPAARCFLPYRAGSTSGYISRPDSRVRFAALYVERSRSTYNATAADNGLDPYAGYGRFRFSGLLRLRNNETEVRLHTFIDRSIVEVFGQGGRAVTTARVYPSRSDSTAVGLYNAYNSNITFTSMQAWRLGSAALAQPPNSEAKAKV